MSQWISVKDSLPEIKDDSVLVFWGGNGGIGMVHIEEWFGDITAGIGVGGNQLYTQWYITSGVTHWMPLPAPPKP